MRWFLTEEQTLIPETSIVKIAPGIGGGAIAYNLDQRGVLGTVMLATSFDELTLSLAAAGEDDLPKKLASRRS